MQLLMRYSECSLGGTAIFYDDRGDVLRRALPRLMAGTAARVLVLLGIPFAVGAAPRYAWGILFALWACAILVRVDVIALQFGPRIRYELDGVILRAFRGSKLKTSINLDKVIYWQECPPNLLLAYWLGSGYYRHLPFGFPFGSFSFTTIDESGGRRTITPPALFRWGDRGGLDDLAAALRPILGESGGLERVPH